MGEHSDKMLRGESIYFLNGVKCRYWDVTDLYLGTGLGPRSHSIIEQGMISRLIEAHPEDLRYFLEEAARISRRGYSEIPSPTPGSSLVCWVHGPDCIERHSEPASRHNSNRREAK